MAKKKVMLPKKSHLNWGIASTEKAPGLRLEGAIFGLVMIGHPWEKRKRKLKADDNRLVNRCLALSIQALNSRAKDY